MEKEEILSEMKTKLGTTCLSDRTMDAYFTGANLPDEGVEPDEAYWTRHVDFLKSLEGQYNHDVAEGVKAAKPKKTEPKKDDLTPPADDEATAKLLKRLEDMEKRWDDAEKGRKADGLRAELAAKGKELNVSNKALWADLAKSAEVPEDGKMETMLDVAKKVYEAKLKLYSGEGAVPYGGSRSGGAGGSEAAAKERREAFKERMRQSGKLPKKEA